jgi:putative flippase GtrA
MWEYPKKLINKINGLLHSSEFLRFFVAGSSAFLTDLIILQFLIRIVGFNPQVLGTLSGANIISSTVGMIISFYLNRNWSFKAKEGKIAGQTVRFLIVQAFSWFLNNLLFGIFTFQFGVNVTVTKIGVTLAQMVWNFFLYKLFVFRIAD